MKSGSKPLCIPNNGSHTNEIDHAPQRFFTTQRQLYDQGARPETLLHHVDSLKKICASPVHLVDKRNPGHVILFRLTPNRLGLRLYAAHRAK